MERRERADGHGRDEPWVTKLPKFRPTIQCHVGPLRSSNVFLMCCAISFSMLNFAMASCAAQTSALRTASLPPPPTAVSPRPAPLGCGCGCGWCRRTDVDGLLLHVLAHVRGLDLRCSRRRLADAPWEMAGAESSNGTLPCSDVPSSFSFTSLFSSWLGTIFALFGLPSTYVPLVALPNLLLGLVEVVGVGSDPRVVARSRYLYGHKKSRGG